MEKKLLVDWLTFTVGLKCFLGLEEDEDDISLLEMVKFKDDAILQMAFEFLGIEQPLEFVATNRHMNGYMINYTCGGIWLCWQGNDNTFMFNFSGEGCRLLETVAPSLDWLNLIKRVGEYRQHNFSRLDIACDTFNELKMPWILRYTNEHRYISRWKIKPLVKMNREETVDFGSPKSRTLLRIYNKTLERQAKADDKSSVPEGWIRCELQMRDDAVDSFVREWRACGDISAVYFGLMANQLRFVKKRPESETNLQRLETVAWWRRFLDNSKPIKLLYKGGLAYNLDSLQKYLYVQAGSSIKTWLVLSDWDVDKMLEMVAQRRINDRQEALIKTMSAVRKGTIKIDDL